MISCDKKGQSTLEYIILVTAVIAVLLFFLNNQNSGFRKALNETAGNATEGMTDMSGKMKSVFNVP